MDNMCKKLIEIGVGFEEYNFQMLHKHQGGADDCVSSGVLRNVDGTYLSNARLEEVMAVAKKKNTYLVVRPDAKAVQGRLLKMFTVKDHELAVCFVQSGVFRMFKDAHTQVDACLKRHFLHFQEEKDLMDLEVILSLIAAQIETFESNPYDGASLKTRSSQLRRCIAREGAAITHVAEIHDYMDDFITKRQADIMCHAGRCLRVMCQ
jgi:hypothetical protein